VNAKTWEAERLLSVFKTQTRSSIQSIKKTNHERKSRQTTPTPFHI
jgi:hypothetical protein